MVKVTLVLAKVNKRQGKSDLHARQIRGALRSFLAFHRVKLEPTPHEVSKLRKGSRKTEDYRFSNEDLRKMAEGGNMDGKYIIIVEKSFGMRAGDFLKLTCGVSAQLFTKTRLSCCSVNNSSPCVS